MGTLDEGHAEIIWQYGKHVELSATYFERRSTRSVANEKWEWEKWEW